MIFPLPHEHVLPHKIKLILPPKQSYDNYNVDRFVGSLVGLAIGNALGASVTSRPRQFFIENPVLDMEGGGIWDLKTRKWTRATSMALCLASSLITKQGYDPYDQMVRYKWYYKDGYLSSTGLRFDIDDATRDSLEEFTRRQKNHLKPYCKANEFDSLSWDMVKTINNFNINCSSPGVAGNGALMRLAPVPLLFYKFPVLAVEYAGRSACLTHGDQKAVDACHYYAALIVAAVRGEAKEDLLNNKFYETHRPWFGKIDLDEDILCVARGSYKRLTGYDDGIRGKDYIVDALEAALWAFWSDDNSFEKGALAAVNLGDDTDRTAAIYGQLAGAFYGYEKIPKKWLKKLYAHDLLVCMGKWLHFQGNQYNGADVEQKMTSSIETSSKISSGYSKVATNHQSPIHVLGFNSQTTYQSDKTQHKFITVERFLDVNEEPKKRLSPVEEYELTPLVTLEESVKSLELLIKNIQGFVWTATGNCEESLEGLNPDERGCIYLYTMECMYRHLNRALRSEDRKQLVLYFFYLHLFLTALWKLPDVQDVVRRGVKEDVSDQYPKGKKFVWWGVTSCTSSLEVLQEKTFLGEEGPRTLFNIQCFNGKMIHHHSQFPSKAEIILLPCSYFEVRGVNNQGPHLRIIQLRQIAPPVTLIQPPFD